ncbi:hypothetical protein M752DRAFT_226469 [Aspergillus phoenicis ATCC 13157]|uniref:Uncharacterized protein n=2 Tax=Aspergillus TaxID=5052 RepID=A0A370P3F4_ASPPH|nr:hypothetical protein M752DRAFT_226469 [Aspergillus phoenicis ATCC 13157]
MSLQSNNPNKLGDLAVCRADAYSPSYREFSLRGHTTAGWESGFGNNRVLVLGRNSDKFLAAKEEWQRRHINLGKDNKSHFHSMRPRCHNQERTVTSGENGLCGKLYWPPGTGHPALTTLINLTTPMRVMPLHPYIDGFWGYCRSKLGECLTRRVEQKAPKLETSTSMLSFLGTSSQSSGRPGTNSYCQARRGRLTLEMTWFSPATFGSISLHFTLSVPYSSPQNPACVTGLDRYQGDRASRPPWARRVLTAAPPRSIRQNSQVIAYFWLKFRYIMIPRFPVSARDDRAGA